MKKCVIKGIPDMVLKCLEKKGIDELRPAQSLSIEMGILEGKNVVISCPTGSGKTLAAEFAIAKHFEKKGKSLYIVPLKSLASEKYKSFIEDYSCFGMKTGLSIGDYDSNDFKLNECDVVIATAEKADSLIRHGSEFMRSVSCIIIDEIHLIDDYSRGPTLEVLVSIAKKLLPKAQFIALSATISNDSEIAKWLDAELVKSDWRAVKLYEGVYLNGFLEFNNNRQYEIVSSSFAEKDLALDAFNNNKQSIFFLSSRRNAQSLANRLSIHLKDKLSEDDKGKLDILADKILYSLEQPTEQCHSLAECVRKGLAFHHAGLIQKQRDLVEKGFRERVIKVICATPTLCLSKDSKIWSGIKEINVDKIKSEKLFALSNNNLINMNADSINKNFNNQKLLGIASYSGHFIKVTPNHKMLIKRNGKNIAIPAKDIKIKDKIATIGNLKILKTRKCKISDFVKENNFPIDCEIEKNISYLIGAILGDGYSGAETNNKKIIYKGSPCIVGTDYEVFEKIKIACKKLKVHFKESKNYYGTCQIVLSKSKWFREFLVKCGVEKSFKKFINLKLMEMKNENIAEIIKGLFDTDGYVNKGRCIGYSSISETLIKSLKKLLLRFGIVSRIRKRPAKTMKIYNKEYSVKPCFEILIAHNKSILKFYNELGFYIKRKQNDLKCLVEKICINFHYCKCDSCNYKIYRDLFSGRTKDQKIWGIKKLEIIKLLNEKKEIGSKDIIKILGYSARKNEARINHHYELINKRKIGKISKTEWFWSLNEIGKWIFKNIIKKGEDLEKFFAYEKCPLCNSKLNKIIKKSWKYEDFEGDIFWDLVKSINILEAEPYVFDVSLPNAPKNDHFFVSDGFIIHNSAGINLPAFRVIVRDLKRFSALQGSYYLPVLEVKQMFGRAGRPGLEDFGEALTIAKSESEKTEIFDEYVFGSAENVYSKLSSEPHLRIHALSLVSSRFCNSIEDVKNFFKSTFFALQYKNMDEINRMILKVVDELLFFGFLEKKNDLLCATDLGKRVCELYLDPLCAHSIIKSIMKSSSFEPSSFSCLQALCFSKGLNLLQIKNNEAMDLINASQKNILMVEEPSSFDFEYDDFLRSIKTAMLFESWIDEISEQQIIDLYKIYPGDLRNLLSSIDWLLYSAVELSRIINEKKLIGFLKRLRVRMKYGIKDELFSLVSMRGIGRVRARKLFNNGIKNASDILSSDLKILSELIGPSLAKKIKNQ